MKPGIKTTEFWLALGVVVLGAIASVYTDSDWAKVAGTAASALAAAGYGFARTAAKAADTAAKAASREMVPLRKGVEQ